jgi:hypothetical protein
MDYYRLRGVKTRRVHAIFIAYYSNTGSAAAIFAARPCFSGSPLHGQEDYRPGVLGATSTSIHTTDFMIIEGTDDPRENIGKTIDFLTISTDGEYKRMEAEIAKVQTVSNALGREKRYMVWLTLTANGISKKILVNLRDRLRMKYKVPMGRGWLARDFLVDVDRLEERVAEEGEEE